jgi:predicted membrane protein
MRIQIFLALIVDYIGLTLRTIAHSATNNMASPLKAISFFVAVFLLICFTCETVLQYYQTNTLYKIEESKLTKHERQLSGIYYDALDMEDVKRNWWVRNFNLIFTGRFMVVSILIYNL